MWQQHQQQGQQQQGQQQQGQQGQQHQQQGQWQQHQQQRQGQQLHQQAQWQQQQEGVAQPPQAPKPPLGSSTTDPQDLGQPSSPVPLVLLPADLACHLSAQLFQVSNWACRFAEQATLEQVSPNLVYCLQLLAGAVQLSEPTWLPRAAREVRGVWCARLAAAVDCLATRQQQHFADADLLALVKLVGVLRGPESCHAASSADPLAESQYTHAVHLQYTHTVHLQYPLGGIQAPPVAGTPQGAGAVPPRGQAGPVGSMADPMQQRQQQQGGETLDMGTAGAMVPELGEEEYSRLSQALGERLGRAVLMMAPDQVSGLMG